MPLNSTPRALAPRRVFAVETLFSVKGDFEEIIGHNAKFGAIAIAYNKATGEVRSGRQVRYQASGWRMEWRPWQTVTFWCRLRAPSTLYCFYFDACFFFAGHDGGRFLFFFKEKVKRAGP